MNAAILGYGTVGGGVYEILKDHPDISVKYVLDKAPVAELGAVSVTDFSVILNDNDGDGRYWMEYTSGVGKTKDTQLFGKITLIK